MGNVTRLPLPDPTPAMRERLVDQLSQRYGPDWDPVLRMAEISENPDWPKSLRLDALKTVAKYIRPQYQSIPDQQTLNNQRPTIVIVDHTRSELLINAPSGARPAKEPLEGELESPACSAPPQPTFNQLFGEF